MPESAGSSSGTTGSWNGPVDATTKSASIVPVEVSTRNPGRPEWRTTSVTSTPQRMGAEIFRA